MQSRGRESCYSLDFGHVRLNQDEYLPSTSNIAIFNPETATPRGSAEVLQWVFKFIWKCI